MDDFASHRLVGKLASKCTAARERLMISVSASSKYSVKRKQLYARIGRDETEFIQW